MLVYTVRFADDDIRVTTGYKGVPFVENELSQWVWFVSLVYAPAQLGAAGRAAKF